MQAIGDIISYFSPYYFSCLTKKSTKIHLGENIWYYSPCAFIFSPLGHAIIVLLSQAVYWGKIFFPSVSMFSPCVYVFLSGHAVWYLLHLIPRQLLGYELEEKQCNISPPGPVFFLLVTEKLVKKLMGERKMVFFPISIFFPLGPCCIWFHFSDSYDIEVHENDDFYRWLKCTFFCV